MEKCMELNVGGSMVVKCANIVVVAAAPVIELTSVTSAPQCTVGDAVTVTVTCTNSSAVAGIANLKFSVVGTGTPTPATMALPVPAHNTATTTFTYTPTAVSATQSACAELVSVSNA